MTEPTEPRPRYSVWAPHADTLELVLVDTVAGELHAEFAERPGHDWPVCADVPMEPATHWGAGWWAPVATALDEALAGLTVRDNPGYGYRINGAGTYPDPRSRRQPDTVHGPSRLDPSVSKDTADITDTATDGAHTTELRHAVLYELHLGTFTPGGTLDAAIEKLDYLAALGITHVELMPVNSFSGNRNWGYDGVGWFAVDESYGGPDAYRRFVTACHARSLAVIQDVVYNHLGPDGNYLPVFGPYLVEAGTGWGDGPALNGPGATEMRQYILDNARMWLADYGVDGLRLDAVHALVDTHEPEHPHLLAQLAEVAEEIAEATSVPRHLIAESDLNDPTVITPRPAGYGLDAQWSDDFHHAVHAAVTGETHGYYADFAPLSALEKVLTHGFFHNSTYSSFRGRDHGYPLPADTANWRLVVSVQNHDQVGNRAAGDRPSAVLDDGQLAIEAVLLLAGPYTPMLFMGEEWGATTPFAFFTAHRDPELSAAVTHGRRREFANMEWNHDDVCDPQDPKTFEDSRLDWSQIQGPETSRHSRLLSLYRQLIRLRSEHPTLTSPDRSLTRTVVDAEAGTLQISRWRSLDDEAPEFRVFCTFGDYSMGLDPEALAGTQLVIAYGPNGPIDEVDEPASAGPLRELPPHAVAVFRQVRPTTMRRHASE